MEIPLLVDNSIFPTDEIVFSHIGKTKIHWITFFEMLKTDYTDFVPEWRYYSDGKSWLMKVQKKSKTVFWLSVIKNGFRVTFYFTDKAEKLILNGNISEKLKEQFTGNKKYGKIKPLTVHIKSMKDIQSVKSLIDMKISSK